MAWASIDKRGCIVTKFLWTLSGHSIEKEELITYPINPHECGKESGPHGNMINQDQATWVSAELGLSPENNSNVVMTADETI